MSARRRTRNRYAALTSAGLVGFAMLCTVLLVSGFGSVDAAAGRFAPGEGFRGFQRVLEVSRRFRVLGSKPHSA